MKMNCWEYKKCGRQPGGPKSGEFGVCPAATQDEFHGVHDGKKAGRACWAIATSLCEGRRQGVFAQKLDYCKSCAFFNLVKVEEESAGRGFAVTPSGMRILMKTKLRGQAVSSNDSGESGRSVGPEDIKAVERSFLFFMGYQGTKMIETVFIELRYKRGSNMTIKDFAFFLKYLLQCLNETHHDQFMRGLPAGVNVQELDY